MFDNIAGNYDFLNHFLSLGIDIYWRKKLVKKLSKQSPKNILDVATGTGDLAIEMLKVTPDKITGIDISNGMLEIGRKKIKEKGLEDKISLQEADSENLPFERGVPPPTNSSIAKLLWLDLCAIAPSTRTKLFTHFVQLHPFSAIGLVPMCFLGALFQYFIHSTLTRSL